MDASGTPAVEFVPPLLRRRLSNLSKAALRSAFDCARNEIDLPTVFASPHGEIHRTCALLGELAAIEPLSPNAFSLSVHNTASGLYAIASGNRAPSTAVAAGADSLEMAIFEARGSIAHGAERVLVVMADEPLPTCYAGFQPGRAAICSLALLIGREAATNSWEISSTAKAETSADEPHAFAVLRMLALRQPCARTAGERGDWQWNASCA